MAKILVLILLMCKITSTLSGVVMVTDGDLIIRLI